MKKSKKTYQTKEEAQEKASRGDGNLVYKVKKGWRIRKRSKPKKIVSVKAYSRRKALKNSGQFPRPQNKDDTKTKVVYLQSLIDNYFQAKTLMDSLENEIAGLIK